MKDLQMLANLLLSKLMIICAKKICVKIFTSILLFLIILSPIASCKEELDPDYQEVHSNKGNAKIGKAGGKIQLDEITLIIPADALSEPVTINIEKRDISNISNRVSLESFISLTPVGLQFRKPVTLVVDLSKSKLKIAAFGQVYQDKYLRLHDSRYVSEEKKLYSELTHFSEWAVVDGESVILKHNTTYNYVIDESFISYSDGSRYDKSRVYELEELVSGAFIQWEKMLIPTDIKFDRSETVSVNSIIIKNPGKADPEFDRWEFSQYDPMVTVLNITNGNRDIWVFDYPSCITSSSLAQARTAACSMEQFLLHEIGHVLGLKPYHAEEESAIMYHNQSNRLPSALTIYDLQMIAETYGFDLSELPYSNAFKMTTLTNTTDKIPPGKAFSAVPTVKVADEKGVGVPGVPVLFRMSHSGHLRFPVGRTDENGIAHCGFWITSTNSENQDLQATVGDVPSLTVNYTAESIIPEEYLFPNSGTFTDIRDNQEYKWITIGKQIWMAQNLNYGKMILGRYPQSDNGVIEKYCIDDLEINGKEYGGLYQWGELMNYQSAKNTNPSGIQGICPSGWHIPSDEEWIELERYLGIPEDEAYYLGLVSRGRVGHLLRSSSGWIEGENSAPYNGLDSFGLNILAIGNRVYWNANESFGGIGHSAYFWTCSEVDNDIPISRIFDNSYNLLRRKSDTRMGYSVRCIKDQMN